MGGRAKRNELENWESWAGELKELSKITKETLIQLAESDQ